MNQLEKQNLLKRLEKFETCSGTSLITMMLPASGPQLTKAKNLMKTETSAASCIKSRTTRQAVQSALLTLKGMLKVYNTHKKIPKNGVFLFCGFVDGGQKVSLAVEPWFEVRAFSYHCGSRFNTEPLRTIYEEEQLKDSVGIVVIDGQSCVIAKTCGSRYEVLHSWAGGNLRKHGKGGQSAARFQRQYV